MSDRGTPRKRWPLLVLAAPAAVAIWSGWVGLGQMSGFGVVHPLPGIADEFTLNSAITLPIGVEAYASLALGTWLSPRPMPGRARRFAAWSALASLGLGLLGQVIYHLLTAAGWDKAPTPVVVFVACLPVLVLGAGATLHHLRGEDPDPVAASADVIATEVGALGADAAERLATSGVGELVSPSPVPGGDELDEDLAPDGVGAVTVDVSDLLHPGREVAATLDAAGEKLTRRTLVAALRERGLSCSTDRATTLLTVLRAERTDHIGRLEAVAI
jgi:hypothetical protein